MNICTYIPMYTDIDVTGVRSVADTGTSLNYLISFCKSSHSFLAPSAHCIDTAY